ncbi:MAG: hypothetical protein H0V37_09300 [Chloroflexia bacterium]|nr:hypothetical protein [Chloroflexia bacterium]
MPTETANALSEPGDWFVFETFGADGTLAIGVARGMPDPSAVMVVRDGLTRMAARDVAVRLAEEYRSVGRLPDSPTERARRVDSEDD